MKNATVGDLIAFLQTLPPTSPVEVLKEKTTGWATSTRFVPLNLDEYCGNFFVPMDKSYVQLGEN